jgi:hypothetical protein
MMVALLFSILCAAKYFSAPPALAPEDQELRRQRPIPEGFLG